MTPVGVMRALLPSRLLFRPRYNAIPRTVSVRVGRAASPSSASCDPIACQRSCRCFAQVKSTDPIGRDVWFSSFAPRSSLQQTPDDDHKPPDERTLQLGKTVRTLHERLPTLLLSPLPSDVLSPQISLHLFPSTHPHLPTVSGRIGYVAALWTAPVAWGRVPLVGNVKLTILSERMVKNGGGGGGGVNGTRAFRDEKLIVKWKTCGKTKHRDGTGGIYRGVGIGGRDPVDRIKEFIAGTNDKDATAAGGARLNGGEELEEEFCGIFVFEFDDEGRVVKHVIEHTDEGGHYDKMTRVVSVTDWLLGHFNGRSKQNVPELAFCEDRPNGRMLDMMHRRR